jgi:CRP/FNR family transcriptional regulator, anaerobic regulatory protein
MRLFYYDRNGDEITTHIVSPNQFITSFTNFIHETKSNVNLECVTNCELYKIERSKLVYLIENNDINYGNNAYYYICGRFIENILPQSNV